SRIATISRRSPQACVFCSRAAKNCAGNRESGWNREAPASAMSFSFIESLALSDRGNAPNLNIHTTPTQCALLLYQQFHILTRSAPYATLTTPFESPQACLHSTPGGHRQTPPARSPSGVNR